MSLKVNQQHNLEKLFDKFAILDPKGKKEKDSTKKDSDKEIKTKQK